MKTLKLYLMTIGIGLSSVLFYSCLGDDDGYSLDKYWIDIVTVVPKDQNSYSFRMDDGITLWPAATNAPYYEAKENQRVMLNFTLLSDSANGYDHFIKVNRIDEILTKNIAENQGEKNDSIYGKDPVEIAGIWVGDNYLNVYFKTYFGGTKKHFINLIPSEDEKAMLEFRHNAYDDPKSYMQGGLVAFNLASLGAENTNAIGANDSISLTVKVNTYEGDKIYEIKYAPLTKGSNKANYLNNVLFEGIE